MSDLVNRTTTSTWQLPPPAGQMRMMSTALVRAQHEQFWAYYIIISRLSADKRLWPCILVNQFIIYKYCTLHIFFLRAAISWVVRLSFVNCVMMFFAPICTAGYGCSSWNFTLIYFMERCNTFQLVYNLIRVSWHVPSVLNVTILSVCQISIPVTVYTSIETVYHGYALYVRDLSFLVINVLMIVTSWKQFLNSGI